MNRGQLVTPKLLAWTFHLALAPAFFALLVGVPELDVRLRAPQAHFWIVSLAAIGGLVIGGIVARSARRHSDARVFLISLAFISIAGIFLMHALSTENMLLDQGAAGFIWSPPLSLLLGAGFFLLGSIRLGDRINSWIVINQSRLLAATIAVLVGYALLVAVFPAVSGNVFGLDADDVDYSVMAEGGVTSPLLAGILIITVGCYIVAAVRYYLSYRSRPSMLLLAILTGMTLFAEADVVMAMSEPWHLSWWLYHLIMVSGFLMVGYGILVQYGRRRTIYGLFEEVFLRQEIARINQSYTEVIIGLINSLEARDRYTKGHSHRVAQYSVLIASALGYDLNGVRRIEQAALLHDIGKLAIPDAVLHKAGKLTPEEFAFIRDHPRRGCAIIQSIDSLQDKAPAILHHHEWLDGTGYPDGLAGEAIPLDARIIAVADVYDALTSLRAYRQPLSREDAIEHLRQEAGRHLDPSCVDAFVRESERTPVVITDFTPQLPLDELVPRVLEPVASP